MTKKLILIAITLAALLVAVVSYKIVETPIEASATSSDSFTINVPYERVRAILIQTKATPKIVAANNGILIEEKWDTGSFMLGPKPIRNKDWEVKAYGTLKIKINDPRIDSPLGTFNQKVDIDPDRMIIETALTEPCGKMVDYSSKIVLTRLDNQRTQVDIEIYLKINYEHIPLQRIRQIIDDNVQSSVDLMLENTTNKLLQIIEEHKDSTFILDLSRLYKSEGK